jgi:hypothetical protein
MVVKGLLGTLLNKALLSSPFSVQGIGSVDTTWGNKSGARK